MGYDLNRFVTKVDEEFICPICTMVLENGVQSQHCEHTYCLKCIKEWLNVNNICPVDRRDIMVDEIKPITRGLKNLLLKLEIRCDFETHGCQTIIRLENLKSHTDVCLFNPNMRIRCNKKCGLEMTQKEYDCHDCLTQLSSLVLTQQKQINKLEEKLTELSRGHAWNCPNGLIVFDSIIECYRNIHSLSKIRA